MRLRGVSVSAGGLYEQAIKESTQNARKSDSFLEPHTPTELKGLATYFDW